MRHFPLGMHKQAEPAARAMQAAHRQGKGFEMADKIFGNMRALSDEDLEKYATEIGVDVAKWKTDFNSPEVKDEVAKDAGAGRAAGVGGTPTIFVNGKRHGGARDVEGFKQAVDAELKEVDALMAKGTT